MVDFDVERLLQPIGGESPCGPDLEYDAEWQELEAAARGKPEQQFGATKIAAEPPKWADARERALGLFARTRDLRVAVLLARAQLAAQGFGGLLPAIKLLHGLIEKYWDSVHPKLDPADNNDPVMRINALAQLGDAEGLVLDLRDAQLVNSRTAGQLTVRQIEWALGRLQQPKEPPKGEPVRSAAEVEAILRAAAAEAATLPALLMDTHAAARDFSALMQQKVGSDRAPDFKLLLDILNQLAQLAQKIAPVPAAGEAATPGGGAAPTPQKGISGEIGSRADVVLLLDKISDFMQRSEPTNPVPLLLERAKKLMSMSFVEIIRDMATGGLQQVETVTGAKADAKTEAKK